MLNELAQEIYKNNVTHGFYDTPVERGTRLMLITSELAEALEADRHKRYAEPISDEFFEYMMNLKGDDFNIVFEDLIKDTYQDEASDAIIRLLDLGACEKMDIDKHVRLKMKYNSLRPYKHGKEY